jgi:hypothetical protein
MQPYFKTIGEIRITNTLSTTEDSPAYAVAVKLLFTGFQGLPVLDHFGKVVGKVTEMDLLKALKASKDLKATRVREIHGSGSTGGQYRDPSGEGGGDHGCPPPDPIACHKGGAVYWECHASRSAAGLAGGVVGSRKGELCRSHRITGTRVER